MGNLELAQYCIDRGAQQKLSEFTQLLDLISKMPNKRIGVELGSYSGGCLYGYLRYFEKVISVDIEHRGQIDGVHYIESDTQSCIKQLRKAMGSNSAKIDFCMIDAGHSFEEVKNDFEMIVPLMRAGGIIALHDIVDSQHHREQGCNVAQFWDMLKNDLKLDCLEFVEGNEWGGIGVIKVTA